MPESAGTVLIVDDDGALGKVLSALLGQAGIGSVYVASAEAALQKLDEQLIDVVISDLRMPGMGGMELLSRVVQKWPDVPVVVLTAHGSVPLAVEAMKRGAADFVLKPFEREEVLFVVQKALSRAQGGRPPEGSSLTAELIGQSGAMASVKALIRRSAATSATVLIRGETGTGKEVVARAIVGESPRRAQPFVKLHCAAVPEALLESELFGHEKGAFTGAVARKAGRVELAAGGTLFLDEIGDVPLAIQVKLLRLLQEREIERVGGVDTIKVDVRFIAATHRPLEQMIERGEFREDLFYRLNVIPVEVPPLRERRSDIPPLARHFSQALSLAHHVPALEIEPRAMELLSAAPWPGNVRQLANLIERMLVLAESPRIMPSDVERELERGVSAAGVGARSLEGRAPLFLGQPSLGEQRHEFERSALLEALRKAKNNRSLAARLLGISRRTLYNKLEELGLR